MKKMDRIKNERDKNYFLGTLKVGSTNNVLPERITKISSHFWDKRIIYLRGEQNNDAIVDVFESVFKFLRDLIQSNLFSFDVFTQEDLVHFHVYLTSIPLPKYTTDSGKTVRAAFKFFFNISSLNQLDSQISRNLSSHELADLYNNLLALRDDRKYAHLKLDNLELLKPTLRPYQEQAVQWMISKEHQIPRFDTPHPLFQKLSLKSGEDIYIDINSGWLEMEIPMVQSEWKGGILADEMGLGKTIEMLALILSHPLVVKLEFDNNDDEEAPDFEKYMSQRTKKQKRSLSPAREPPPNKKIVSNKSTTFQALQKIYNETLSGYCTTGIKKPAVLSEVQCTCGHLSEEGCVKCVDCSKLQHAECMQWRPRLGPYSCSQCWEKKELIPSKATLIVVPESLQQQWCKEIETHLMPGLKVLVYNGYKIAVVYPTEFQKYDIVITTYCVLRAELKLTETSQSLNLRNRRKYWPHICPLLRINWWRLCLDEAQIVEAPHHVVSMMAQKISAVHRWAVTGTPMAKGVSDVYGLVDFLQIAPYNDQYVWTNALYAPYCRGDHGPMMDFLSKVLWRTPKTSVLDQINIPKQSEQLYFLEFSALEKFYYQREHNLCSKEFLKIANRYQPELLLDKMNKMAMKILMGPLLCLRQVCLNPSTVTGKGRFITLKKGASSMKDLLDALISKNKIACEDTLRLIVSAINGLAGIYLLFQNYDQAIQQYRKVLELSARFATDAQGKLAIDKLLLIHAMHNLAEVFQYHPPKEHTLRDGTLREDCERLERDYIEKFMKETATGLESCRVSFTAIDKLKKDLELKYGSWYSDGFDWATLNDFENDLISRAEVAAANTNIEYDLRGESTRTLLRRLYNWHLDLDGLRDTLYESIESIYVQDDVTGHVIIAEGLVEKAMECHLRPQPDKRDQKKVSKCPVCVANVHLKKYEGTLFTMKQRTEMFEEMGLVGGWKPRLEEILLRSLLGLMKIKGGQAELISDGEKDIAMIEVMKKEFKEIRKLWTLLDKQVCAQDELDICKVRLQLNTEEPKKKTTTVLKNLCYEQAVAHENIHLIHPTELPHQELLLIFEEKRQRAHLEKLLGTRNYLGTLKQQQFEGYTPDPCPICRGPLENTWAIFSCAHTYCIDCSQALVQKSSSHIHCSVCRAKQYPQDVGYITNGQDGEGDATEETMVLGNYSRKMDAVIRLVLSLRSKDPLVKILLLSTWIPVLKLLKNALELNDVRTELVGTNHGFDNHISAFKDPAKKVTLLLLPIHLGSKGLNLIEATHVILLEPLLNPSDELQAVGRVHRLGQTKETFVHKFIVRDTIEESLYNATNSNAEGWEKGRVTVGQLKKLFELPSAEQAVEEG